MLEVLISSIAVVLISRRMTLLKKSSLNRLLIIPFFLFVCYLFNKALKVNNLDIELYFFSGYVLYQAINMANTSRRCSNFLNLGKQIDTKQSVEQRIETLEKGYILVFRDGKYEVRRSGLYFFYLCLSYLVLSARLRTE